MNDKFPYGIQYFDIELNTYCNARCSYCRIFEQHLENSRQELSVDDLDLFYSKLVENPPENFYSIDFAETEPLLSFGLIKHIFEKYPIERDNGFFHSITTNGKALTKEMLDFFALHNIVVKISLDGTKENCLKEKEVDIDFLFNLLKQMKKKELLALNYVITEERLSFLEQDLEQIFSLANELQCEWAYLLNVLNGWNENNFNLMVQKMVKFLNTHYNRKLNYILRTNSVVEPRMTGIGIRANGTLSLMPANHSCKQPIDENFLKKYKNCGTIKNPDALLIQEYLKEYGLNYSKTSFIGEKCQNCLCKESCNIEQSSAKFLFSKEDCLVNIYNERIRQQMSKDNFDYNKAKEDFYISSVCLGLTNACNMRCRYCFTSPSPKYMNLATAISSVMWIKQNQGNVQNTHINFFGGEPMLMFDEIIKPLIEWSNEMNISKISYGMTTNGTLLNEERIKWLAENKVSILLSIDGGPKTQNYNRVLLSGEDSFTKVADNIPCLLAYHPNTTFRATAYPDTIEYTYENYLWAKALGFKSYFVMPDEFSEWSPEKIKIFVEQLNQVYWDHYNSLTKEEDFPAMKDFFNMVYEIMGIPLYDVEKPYLRCGLGTTGLGIGTNGDIYGCQEHLTYDHSSPFFLGNIFDGGIDDNRRERLIKMYMDGSPENCHLCPSHCWGVFKNLKDETKIHKIWREATRISCWEILKDAAETHNQIFLDYIREHNFMGEGL